LDEISPKISENWALTPKKYCLIPVNFAKFQTARMPHLSYWERSFYFKNTDVVIIGGGIVGLSTGISLLEKQAHLRVLILEKNYLPLGASTKNAGFACFGSPSELLEDLKKSSADQVFTLFNRRFQGIQKLIQRTGPTALDLKPFGGYELIHPELSSIEIGQKELDYLNQEIEQQTGLKSYYRFKNEQLETWGLTEFESLVANEHESCINPMWMIHTLQEMFRSKGGKLIHGIGIKSWQDQDEAVEIELEDAYRFHAKQLLFCVNGFAKRFFPELEVNPARNSVLLIETEKPIPFRGCFHINCGYVYFRELDGKLLIGGGRNLDFETESTDAFGINETIKMYLCNLVSQYILPDQKFAVVEQWSGILGLGEVKKPIIKQLAQNIYVAVRLGGMGVAIGSLVGEEAADLLLKNERFA